MQRNKDRQPVGEIYEDDKNNDDFHLIIIEQFIVTCSLFKISREHVLLILKNDQHYDIIKQNKFS